jgi:hypothetical protein
MGTNEFAIVKLKKNGTIEYPVTRPECVMYPDGSTVYGRIDRLEKGANVVWGVYESGNKSYYPNDEIMFTDEYRFKEYYSAMMNNVMKSYYSYEVTLSNEDVYPWSSVDDDKMPGNRLYVRNYQTDGDDKRTIFSTKNFACLMHGYAPSIVVTDSTEVYEGKTYDIIEYLDAYIATEDDFFNKEIVTKPTRCVKLIMKPQSPADYTYNGTTYKDQVEMYFFPEYKTDIDMTTESGSDATQKGVYTRGATVVRNPAIVARNNSN